MPIPAIHKLTGTQMGEFRNALLSAFPNIHALASMLAIRLNKNLAEITLAPDLKTQALAVIQAARAQGWTDQLLLAARAEVPDNFQLFEFAQQFGYAPSIEILSAGKSLPAAPVTRGLEGPSDDEADSESNLERLIKKSNLDIDVGGLLMKLPELAAKICKIEYKLSGANVTGTGFLIGPDVVITNYHVVEPLIKEKVQPKDLILRFDFKTIDGSILDQGTKYTLATDWLIDQSKYSRSDLEAKPATPPKTDELDFALLRVQAPANNTKPARGWIEIPTTEHDFTNHKELFILQHPDGRPLKLAMDTDAIIDVNENKTRVRYETNTEHGSSGSPCFDANWNLVALHHSGDPNYDAMHHPEYNQGIPFQAIVKLLEDRNKLDLIKN
jgi:V8-like Glu-specific endopeptidase